jgi:hypothetical protein
MSRGSPQFIFKDADSMVLEQSCEVQDIADVVIDGVLSSWLRASMGCWF